MADYYSGNAADDSVAGTGWFVGQFVPLALGSRHQTALELKWGVHPSGESRPGGPAAPGVNTTISVLVEGRFRVMIGVGGERQAFTLERPGDYVVFGPKTAHDWHALEDSIVLTIRFPSVEVKAMAGTRGA